MRSETVRYCLHLAAFGCQQCKDIVEAEIQKERQRCLEIVQQQLDYELAYGNIDSKAACSGIRKRIRGS